MKFGSLFSGIGGLDLGLERAGMQCVWQVENDPYAQKVLQKHWPEVRRWDDVRTFLPTGRDWSCDLICGGFPCQDISNAGRRAGIGGQRSGLWSEFARIIRVLRPRYVLVENVPALTVRGLGRVLGDLAQLGYDAEWDRIPAAAVGAPHLRWRLFIVAYASEHRHENRAAANRQNTTRTEFLPTRPRKERQRTIDVNRNSDGDVSDATCRFTGQLWREQFATYCETTRDLYWPEVVARVRRVYDGPTDWLDANHLIGMEDTHGDAKKTNPPQGLRTLQDGVGEEAIQRRPGRFELLQQEGLLRENVHGGSDGQRESNAIRLTQSGKEIPQDALRNLQDDEDRVDSSFGRQSGKQFDGELNDLVQLLSSEVALEKWTYFAEAAVGVQNLRDACEEIGYVSKTLSAFPKIWRSMPHEEAKRAAVCAVQRYLPVSPTSGKCSNRVARLRGLGNAVLPQISEWIGRRIMEYEKCQKSQLT